MTSEDPELMKAKLNGETAQIGWLELQRFFAAGKVICVDSRLDLVEVASQCALNNAVAMERWQEDGLIAPVTDDQASLWFEEQKVLWGVVVSPWVLVQDRAQTDTPE